MWTLTEPSAEPVSKEQIRQTMTVSQAITALLAEAYPKPLTVFELAVDLSKYWKVIPTGAEDQHSTVYRLLENGRPGFVETNPTHKSKT